MGWLVLVCGTPQPAPTQTHQHKKHQRRYKCAPRGRLCAQTTYGAGAAVMVWCGFWGGRWWCLGECFVGVARDCVKTVKIFAVGEAGSPKKHAHKKESPFLCGWGWCVCGFGWLYSTSCVALWGVLLGSCCCCCSVLYARKRDGPRSLHPPLALLLL